MARTTRTTRQFTAPVDRFAETAPAAIAVLIGAGSLLLSLGLLEHFYDSLDCTPLTFRIVTGSCLVGFALGPRMLRGTALRLARAARARLAASAVMQEAARRGRGVDRDLLWIATGVAGLASGLCALLLPLFVHLADAVLDWGAVHFLWLESLLSLFEACVILPTVCIPLALAGFFLRCVHQLPNPAGRWDMRAAVWSLYGVGAAMAVVGLLSAYPCSGKLLMRVGAVPLLAAAIIAVAKASPVVRGGGGGGEAAIEEPDIGERWPLVLRVALAVSIMAAVTVGMMWVYVVRAAGLGSYGTSLAGGGLLFAAVGGGISLSIHRSKNVQHTIGAMGVRFAASGVAIAGGVSVFNLVLRTSPTLFLGSPGSRLLWGMAACLPLGALGYAIGFGGIAIASRRGWDSDTGSRLLRMMALAAGAAFVAVAIPMLDRLGSYATMVAASLTLLATGGVLMIHEPSQESGGRRVGLAGVFAAVIAMMCFMPWAGSDWFADLQARRVRFAESWWLVWGPPRGAGGLARYALAASGRERSLRPASTVADLVDWPLFPRDGRIGVITLAPSDPSGLSDRDRSVDVWSLGSRPYRFADRQPAGKKTATNESASALRSLRASRDRYELMVLECRDWPLSLTRRVIGSRMLQRAIERLSPDGVLIALLPAGSADLLGLDAADDDAISSLHPHAELRSGNLGGSPCLALVTGRKPTCRLNADRWCTALRPVGEPTLASGKQPEMVVANSAASPRSR